MSPEACTPGALPPDKASRCVVPSLRALQDHIYDTLASAYGVVAVVALVRHRNVASPAPRRLESRLTTNPMGAPCLGPCLTHLLRLTHQVQLGRIQHRVPEYGWTTQKVFHLLNFLCAALRAGVFACRQEVDALHPPVWRHILLDLPGLLFFTTYALLVLFWAEIYHQARSLPTSPLRPAFAGANAVVYTVQATVWLVFALHGEGHAVSQASALFLSLVNLSAAAGFLVYGRRLFTMLRRFPIESKGRRKKLREVGAVTLVCGTCFSSRACVVAYAAFHRSFAARLDVMTHPVLNCFYYGAVEVLPAALVLYILRKLPPKRAVGYAPVPGDGAAEQEETTHAGPSEVTGASV